MANVRSAHLNPASLRPVALALALILGLPGPAALAADGKPKLDLPFTCGGNPGAEKCTCITADACRSMLDRCKSATMTCTGPVCTCDMARKRPGAVIGETPKAGAGTARSVGN